MIQKKRFKAHSRDLYSCVNTESVQDDHLIMLQLLFYFHFICGEIVLQNKFIRVDFDASTLTPIFLSRNGQNQENLLSKESVNHPTWSCDILVANETQIFQITSLTKSKNKTVMKTQDTVVFTWIIDVNGYDFSVTTITKIDALTPSLSFSLGFEALNSFPHLGLWSFKLSPMLFRLKSSHVVLENYGFGITHPCEQSCDSFGGMYPGSNTFQFLSLYEADQTDQHSSVYFGSHDPNGESKILSCETQRIFLLLLLILLLS